ncbi:MAG: hypothetical protein ACKO48_00140, partial [Actinomycetota bacterium]
HMDRTDLGYRLERDDVDVNGRPINPRHVGFYNMGMASQSVSELHFDVDTTSPNDVIAAQVTARFNDGEMWNLQLSAMDWSVDGSTNPDKHHIVTQGRRPQMIAERVVQCYGNRVERARFGTSESTARLVTLQRGSLGMHSEYHFPSLGDMPSSPTFVQRPGGRAGGGDGWVIVNVLSDDGFRVECFDAASVSGGPIAVLRSVGRDRLPFLLHSVLTTSARPAPHMERLSPATELLAEVSARAREKLPDALRAAVHEVAESFVAY